MADEMNIKGRRLRLQKGDITDLDIESFVYYAQPDLALGSGFGTAIAVRGGQSIKEELKTLGPVKTTGVVVSSAGDMKAKHIIHAVGPRFQEEDLENKLRATVLNCLKAAEGKGIRAVAFPPMGAGFYGVPLDVSARITLGTIHEYLLNKSKVDEVVVCLLDNREYQPFLKELQAIA